MKSANRVKKIPSIRGYAPSHWLLVFLLGFKNEKINGVDSQRLAVASKVFIRLGRTKTMSPKIKIKVEPIKKKICPTCDSHLQTKGEICPGK